MNFNLQPTHSQHKLFYEKVRSNDTATDWHLQNTPWISKEGIAELVKNYDYKLIEKEYKKL